MTWTGRKAHISQGYANRFSWFPRCVFPSLVQQGDIATARACDHRYCQAQVSCPAVRRYDGSQYGAGIRTGPIRRKALSWSLTSPRRILIIDLFLVFKAMHRECKKFLMRIDKLTWCWFSSIYQIHQRDRPAKYSANMSCSKKRADGKHNPMSIMAEFTLALMQFSFAACYAFRRFCTPTIDWKTYAFSKHKQKQIACCSLYCSQCCRKHHHYCAAIQVAVLALRA